MSQAENARSRKEFEDLSIVNRSTTYNSKASIVVVPDPSLGRERQASLHRTWALLRTLGPVTILPGKTTESQLIEHLDKSAAQLVLLPWQHYLGWIRAEGFYGLTRTSGPTVAGYFGSPIERHEIGATTPFHRMLLLDFSSTSQLERWRFARALLDEKLRSGIRPLLEPRSIKYFEDWLGSHPPGSTIDSLITLPALRSEPWKGRLPAIQLITLSLWNLAFEQGRALARGDWLTQIHAGRIRAYFEIAMDSDVLAMRLCFQQNANTSKMILRDFWPEPGDASPSDFRQVLLQHADFLRIHPIADMTEVEIVAGLLKSAPAQQHPGELRNFWIEPLSMHLVSEIPTRRNQEGGEREQPLPPLQSAGVDERASLADHALRKVAWLERELAERDARIEELISGGVGAPRTTAKKAA
jgi:hypothetical protein